MPEAPVPPGPVRIARRRAAGWRMPPGTVYVGRPGPFGNPFTVGATTPGDWHPPFAGIEVRDRAHAADLLREYLAWRSLKPAGWHSPLGPNYPWESQIRTVLRGRDLACWCPIGEPCHADVLIEIANEGGSDG